MKMCNNRYILTISLLLLSSMSGCSWREDKHEDTAMADVGTKVHTTSSGLQYIDLKTVEDAPSPSAYQNVEVHYTGWLYDENASENKGQKFDSSVDRGQTFVFPVGAGRVIKGWDEGVITMKIGEKRRLIISSELGYGSRGAGAIIPPDATLVFDVELISIK